MNVNTQVVEMFIPPCRGIEPITTMEPINHNEYQEILGQDDTKFFIEIHLLAGELVLVVAIHSLGGSRANWYHRPNPQ